MSFGCRNWKRQDWFDETGLPWVNPSPNLRSFRAEILYPGLEILQAGGVSVGRGHAHKPFERIGRSVDTMVRSSPHCMNRRSIPWLGFSGGPVHSGFWACTRACFAKASRVAVTDRILDFSLMRMGIEIAGRTCNGFIRASLQVAKMIELVGNAATIERALEGDSPCRNRGGLERETLQSLPQNAGDVSFVSMKQCRICSSALLTPR